MKENMPKRNGLAMGRYRDHPRALAEGRHCKDIKWAKEGEWVICLGVPFGNDLDTSKWWKKKVESVRDKATHWIGLFRASYFGRNLIVQAMYFGSLRYWLYSLVMPQEVVAMVQADADTLWWSREPELGTAKRVRRFVRGKTAIGQRKKAPCARA